MSKRAGVKATNGWAVVTPDGEIHAASVGSKGHVINQSLELDMILAGCLGKKMPSWQNREKQGWRCIQVTIQPVKVRR